MIGTSTWATFPDSPLFSPILCHMSEVGVTLPIISEYPCSEPIYGKFVILDRPGNTGIDRNSFDCLLYTSDAADE